MFTNMHIQQNVSLKNYNTFGVDVKAKYFAEAHSVDELRSLLQSPELKTNPLFVLGGGSNLLLTKDYEGFVLKVSIKEIKECKEDNDVFVEAGAGEVWKDFVNYCVDKGFAGIENLSLIPGTVGASPIQNIGAYGVELKDVFHSLRAIEINTGELKTFSKEECEFAYRESIFKGRLKGKYIITSVVFKLSTVPHLHLQYGAIEDELKKRGIAHPGIKEVSDVVSHIRVSKLPDPSTIGNSGSFFKNPIIPKAHFEELIKKFPDLVHYPAHDHYEKIAAGWLIEQCGWKGKQVGHTGTWKNQALVIVNHGGATGKEIYDFSEQIIRSVHDRFGITLEREVNII